MARPGGGRGGARCQWVLFGKWKASARPGQPCHRQRPVLRRRRSAVPVAFAGCRIGPGTSLPPSPGDFLGLELLGSSTDQPEAGRDQGEADAFFPAEVLAQEGGGEGGGYQRLEGAVGGYQGGGGAADRPGAGGVGEDGGEDDDVGHTEPGAGPYFGGIEGRQRRDRHGEDADGSEEEGGRDHRPPGDTGQDRPLQHQKQGVAEAVDEDQGVAERGRVAGREAEGVHQHQGAHDREEDPRQPVQGDPLDPHHRRRPDREHRDRGHQDRGVGRRRELEAGDEQRLVGEDAEPAEEGEHGEVAPGGDEAVPPPGERHQDRRRQPHPDRRQRQRRQVGEHGLGHHVEAAEGGLDQDQRQVHPPDRGRARRRRRGGRGFGAEADVGIGGCIHEDRGRIPLCARPAEPLEWRL